MKTSEPPSPDQGSQTIVLGKGNNRHTQTWQNTTTSTGDNSTKPSTHTVERQKVISPKVHKINLTLESFNCYGFSRTADYILERLQNCDIMGLTETWLRPNELHSIESALQNHPNFKNEYKNYEIFSKSGMTEIEADYSGWPFGGVSVIIKK